MDLSLIVTHLENFVDTWDGWKSIVDGLKATEGLTGIDDAFASLSSNLDVAFDELSSVELSSEAPA